MANTDHLAIPVIAASQAQKHVSVNEGMLALDAIVQLTVIDKDLTAPPGSPSSGDRYIVGTSATGDWAGQDGNIAAYQNSAWEFYAPNEGWGVWVEDESTQYIRVSSAWVDLGSALAAIQNLALLGVNATADTTNKLSVNSDAVLFNNNGSDSQVKVNKASTGDDASHIFQNGFSTRALFGLLANDDFTLKVSPDGSTFYNALEVDKGNGEVTAPQGIILGSNTRALNDYDDGPWTPALGASTTNPTGVGESISGVYVRVGNLVFSSFELIVTTKGTGGVGNVQITGLPFYSAGNFYGADLRHSGVTFPGSGAPMMRSSGTNLTLFSTDGSDMLWSHLPTGAFSLLGSFTYRTTS